MPTTKKTTSKLSQIRKASKTGKLTPGFITELGTRKQTGKSIERADKQHRAIQPGYRISKSGRLYYEARQNRSDTPSQISAYTKSHAQTSAAKAQQKATKKQASSQTVKIYPATPINTPKKQIQKRRTYDVHYYDYENPNGFNRYGLDPRREDDDENKILLGKYKQELKRRGMKLRSVDEIKAAEKAAETEKWREQLKAEKKQNNRNSAAEIAIDMYNAKSITVTYYIPRGKKSKKVYDKVTWIRNPKNMNEWSESKHKTDYYSTSTASKFIAARKQELEDMWKVHPIMLAVETKLMPEKIIDRAINPYYEDKEAYYWLRKINDNSTKYSSSRGKWNLQKFKKLSSDDLRDLRESNIVKAHTWEAVPSWDGGINTADELAAKAALKKLALRRGWRQTTAADVKEYVSSVASKVKNAKIRIRTREEGNRRAHIAYYKQFKLPTFQGAKKMLVKSKLTAATLRGCKGAAVIDEGEFYKDSGATAKKEITIYVCGNNMVTEHYKIEQNYNYNTKKWETVDWHHWDDSKHDYTMSFLANTLNREVGLNGYAGLTTVENNGKWVDARPAYNFKNKGTVVYYK